MVSLVIAAHNQLLPFDSHLVRYQTVFAILEQNFSSHDPICLMINFVLITVSIQLVFKTASDATYT